MRENGIGKWMETESSAAMTHQTPAPGPVTKHKKTQKTEIQAQGKHMEVHSSVKAELDKGSETPTEIGAWMILRRVSNGHSCSSGSSVLSMQERGWCDLNGFCMNSCIAIWEAWTDVAT
eukprot:1158281-Pelagomonas_calceolata.AAC.11